MKHTSITEANINALVHAFYARVQRHETLGPVFNPALTGRWDVHLARMVDFWSSVLLANGRYYGRPLHAHLMVQGLAPEHFRDWLELFRETLDDLFIPDVAERIFTAAKRMGERIKSVLFERSQTEGYEMGSQKRSFLFQLADLKSIEIDANRPNRRLLVQQPGIKVMHVTLATGQRLSSHRHPGCHVLLQALEGTTTVQLEGDEIPLSPRQLLSFSGENLVSLWNDSNATSVLLITLVKQVNDKEEK